MRADRVAEGASRPPRRAAKRGPQARRRAVAPRQSRRRLVYLFLFFVIVDCRACSTGRRRRRGQPRGALALVASTFSRSVVCTSSMTTRSRQHNAVYTHIERRERERERKGQHLDGRHPDRLAQLLKDDERDERVGPQAPEAHAEPFVERERACKRVCIEESGRARGAKERERGGGREMRTDPRS